MENALRRNPLCSGPKSAPDPLQLAALCPWALLYASPSLSECRWPNAEYVDVRLGTPILPAPCSVNSRQASLGLPFFLGILRCPRWSVRKENTSPRQDDISGRDGQLPWLDRAAAQGVVRRWRCVDKDLLLPWDDTPGTAGVLRPGKEACAVHPRPAGIHVLSSVRRQRYDTNSLRYSDCPRPEGYPRRGFVGKQPECNMTDTKSTKLVYGTRYSRKMELHGLPVLPLFELKTIL
jgi:hypothetical protein